MTEPRPRVLVLCTGNSARSQIAEALFRHLSGGRVDVVSAGSEPQRAVHPLAIETLKREFDIDDDSLRPKPVGAFAGQTFDYVITVCDHAAEVCPVFPGAHRIHWSFEDPAALPDAEPRRRAFKAVADGLAAHIQAFLETLP